MRRRSRRPQSGASRRAAPQAAARYTGNPVSLDFQGADLRAVLRTFSEISGLNLVIDPTIQGTVDVALRDVPWDQALDIILRANKLGTWSMARSSVSRRWPCWPPRKRSGAVCRTRRRWPAS